MTDTPPKFAEDVWSIVEQLPLAEQERLLHLLISDLTGLSLSQVQRMSRQQLKQSLMNWRDKLSETTPEELRHRGKGR